MKNSFFKKFAELFSNQQSSDAKVAGVNPTVNDVDMIDDTSYIDDVFQNMPSEDSVIAAAGQGIGTSSQVCRSAY